MAKNNNLGDLLTSIANAIRTKKSSTSQINAQDFDTEILSLAVGSSTVFFKGPALLSTDTVTLTGNGKTYSGIWNADFNGESGFVISDISEFGTFNYTYIQGNKTKTGTILIDILGIYTIYIGFELYLYNEGDECTSVTGGWSKGLGKPPSWTWDVNEGTITKETSDIKIQGGSNSWTDIATNVKVDIHQYSKLKIIYDINMNNNSGNRFFGGYGSTRRANEMIYNNTIKYGIDVNNECNITGLSENEYYICFALYIGGGSTSYVKIKKIWLE